MIEKRILVSNWTIIQQIQSLAVRVVELSDSVIFIDEHLGKIPSIIFIAIHFNIL